MKIRLILALATMVLLAAACSSGGGTGDSPPDDVSEALDQNTEPVIATTTIDASRAATARIGPDGGSLTATGADGSRFLLEIPADAMIDEIEITMTPIESMDGLPLPDGLAAGVQLEPEGMAFYDFVTLTIEPAVSIPVDHQLPIGTSGTTGAVYLPLIDLDPDAIRLQLTHFSSAGLSKGLTSDLEPVRQRLGGDADARLNSLFAREVAWARQHGQSNVDMVAATFLLDEYRKQVIEPRLKAASESCAAARLAMLTSINYGRLRMLVGLSDESDDELEKLTPIYAKVCLQEEYELCRDEHIVHRMLPVISHLEKLRFRTGLFTAEMDQIMAHAQDLAVRCLHFEVVFESSARMESDGTYNESEVESKIEIRYDPGSIPPAVTGSSALVNTKYEVSDPIGGACKTTGNRGGGTFEVMHLLFTVVRSGPDDPVGHVEDVRLIYAPGISTETVTATCPGAGSMTTPPNSIWSNTYLGVHRGELGGYDDLPGSGEAQPPPIAELTIDQIRALMQSGGQPGALPGGLGGEEAGSGATYTTKGWEVDGGEFFAEKEWELAVGSGGASMTEEGSFKLYHRPQ